MAFDDKDKNNLILTGKILPPNGLTDGNYYDIDFYDIQDEEMKKITCQAHNTGGSCTLLCDTSKTPLKTNYGNLTLFKHESENLYFSINIPESVNKEEQINAGPCSNRNTFTEKVQVVYQEAL